MWSLQKAAATSVYLADSTDVTNVTAEFFGNLKVKNIKEKYRRQEDMNAIWEYCNEICKGYL
ncbi:hypothetical protein DCO58_08685 [Helicobacter saguini]|uniref:Uncharacterized protein n=1 Tax=Helicobacter saguini TaxID=1548018 RepID=A0A347VNX2_9HELI|nr:hypothetical protein [Helicobacter saguini]MWV61601.1 hypothetical protein [Helicobacter saguini]MWV67727.1 hypothetical protein [Helicobacter saguini]MWV70079.1 hypothetical protein [Helicobacter saguini]MWV72708.1 hypothetical protein [Helicobacter saguini]TLD92026.1 hypothetical protein LS64_010995 [Helicobacter saguini]